MPAVADPQTTPAQQPTATTVVDAKAIDLSDHGPEVQLYGPPGTGKTTALTHWIRETVRYRGADSVMVSSFTVTAAAELAAGKGSKLPLPKGAIGTLHSHAKRATGLGAVVTEALDDWNDTHPGLALSGKTRKGEAGLDDPYADGGGGATDGDSLLSEMDSLRNRMTPREEWPRKVAHFAEKWEEWKRDNDVVDFTDMIEIALRDTETAPSHPEVGFFDEVQDNTALELALIRKWGKAMRQVVMAGDDDQMIYGFRGASPDGLLSHQVAAADTLVLGQSHRIPASVHRAAEMWIRRVSARQEKRYVSRAEEGRCLVSHRLKGADGPGLVRAIEKEIAQTVTDPVTGRTRPKRVMVLASCAYMIDPVKHALRDAGVPFWNPYRTKRSDWNPMAQREGAITSRERLLSYLIMDERAFGEQRSRIWTGEDVRRWVGAIKTSGILPRGHAEALQALPNRSLDQDTLLNLFDPRLDDDTLGRILGPDLDWFESALNARMLKDMRFPLHVARRRGPAALVESPQVCLGTIHSVKGGEADIVFLLPDLSQRGYQEFERAGETRDGVIRQMYVAMTRARQELVVCAPSDRLHISPERLVQGAKVAPRQLAA
jgi:DNA helicase-2/ATP-dependent DNA helicase PcrA